jgi:tetratricopeptide (TPR) repeat protein
VPKDKQPKSKSTPSRLHDDFYRKLFVLIPILTFLLYLGVLGQQYLTGDDDWYIYRNPYVIDLTWDKAGELLTQPYAAQYSPLPQLYLALLFKLGGGQPFLMKLVALLTHMLNSFLVFRLFSELTNEYRAGFFVAALFAVHPVQVESVAWLTAIFKISACFSLMSMLLYLKFLETRKRVYYAGIVLLFTLSFMSKEQAVLLPLSLVLIDFVRGRSLLNRRVIIEKLPLFLMSLAYGVVTLLIAASATYTQMGEMSLAHKPYLTSLALGLYFQKLLVPVGYSTLYVTPVFPEGLQPLHLVLPVIVLLGLTASLLALRKERIGLFGMLFWLVNLSLSLAFALAPLRYAFIADRYMYLASVGFFLVLYSLLRRWIEARPGARRITELAVVVYLVLLMAVTYVRTPVFHDDEALWTDAVRQNPDNYHAYRFLGGYYFKTGQLNKAMFHTNTAIEKYALALQQPVAESDFVDAISNRAAIYVNLKEYDKALADLERALSLDPDRIDALYNRAMVLYELKKYLECLREVDRLLTYEPNAALSLNLAGQCYYQVGDYRTAVAFFSRAIESNSSNGLFWLNRSQALHRLRDNRQALSDAMQAQKMGAPVNPAYLNRLRN